MWSGTWNSGATVFTGVWTPAPGGAPTGTTKWTGTVTVTISGANTNYAFAGAWS